MSDIQRIAYYPTDDILFHPLYVNKNHPVLTKAILCYANLNYKVINGKFTPPYTIYKPSEILSET